MMSSLIEGFPGDWVPVLRKDAVWVLKLWGGEERTFETWVKTVGPFQRPGTKRSVVAILDLEF